MTLLNKDVTVGYRVQWTIPAYRGEWVDTAEYPFKQKVDAEIEVLREVSRSKVPDITFRVCEVLV